VEVTEITEIFDDQTDHSDGSGERLPDSEEQSDETK
jgi:hypothetical protein